MKTLPPISLPELILVFVTLIFSGCASYTPTTLNLGPSELYTTVMEKEGISFYMDQYITKEKSKKVFAINLRDKGVLPLLVGVENNGKHPIKIMSIDVLNEYNTKLRILTPQEAANKAHGYLGSSSNRSFNILITRISTTVAISTT